MNATRGNAISNRLCAVIMAERFGYTARFAPIGPVVDSGVGSPMQMGLFIREST